MSTAYQIVVCGSIVPDPLQTLEPVASPTGPALKNEMMLPAVLDPWAGHALFEAANLAKHTPGSKVWLVSLGPKAKLQQAMMTVAQKVPVELVALDGSAIGFTEATAAIPLTRPSVHFVIFNFPVLFFNWECSSEPLFIPPPRSLAASSSNLAAGKCPCNTSASPMNISPSATLPAFSTSHIWPK